MERSERQRGPSHREAGGGADTHRSHRVSRRAGRDQLDGAGILAGAFGPLGPDYAQTWLADIWGVTIAQIAPIMPYLLLVLILAFRPMGLLGTRET